MEEWEKQRLGGPHFTKDGQRQRNISHFETVTSSSLLGL